MEIERIVKNGPAYGAHSNWQVIFSQSHRNQIPMGISNGPGSSSLERTAPTFVGYKAFFFSVRWYLVMRTGKQGAVPQQFTMKTFIPRFDLKRRNGLGSSMIQGRSISAHGRMDVAVRVHRPRHSGRRHQDHPETGQQYIDSSGIHVGILHQCP